MEDPTNIVAEGDFYENGSQWTETEGVSVNQKFESEYASASGVEVQRMRTTINSEQIDPM